MKAIIKRKSTLLGLAGVLISLLSYQAKAQPGSSPHPVDPQALARMQFPENPVGTEDISFKDKVIPADLLASGIARLSRQLESIELLRRPFLVLTECRITGDLKLDHRKISVPMAFNNVIFEGDPDLPGATLDLTGATVDASLFFLGGEVRGDTVLTRASIRALYIGLDPNPKYETHFKGSFTANKTVFIENPRFRHVLFEGDASFEEAEFKKGADFTSASSWRQIQFKQTVFSSVTDFRFSTFPNASFEEATFEKEVYFNEATFSHLVTFAKTKFQSGADFGDAQFRAAQFQGTFFGEATSFNRANFTYAADFTKSRFSGEVDFEGCIFPSTNAPATENEHWDKNEWRDKIEPGLLLSQARFEKRVRLTFDQLVASSSWRSLTSPQTKLRSEPNLHPERTWEDLARAFTSAGNLSSRNEAEYQRQLAIAGFRDPSRKPGALDRFYNAFWGYGLRPVRVLLWIVLSYVGFAAIYWTQAKLLSARLKGWRGQLDRVLFAAGFSWRSAYKLTYGYDNSRTFFFKVLTMVQSLGSKVLLFFFLKSLANASPLISELVNKVLPWLPGTQ